MSDTANDSGMVRMMIIVMGALTVFTLFCIAMARIIGIGPEDTTDPLMRNALLERIKPAGEVRTVLEADTGGAAAVAVVADLSVEDMFTAGCAACHGNPGLPDAPKVGDDTWASREGGDIAALTASAIAGKGQMPARGASTYDDEQIRQIVEYMVGQ